MTKDDEEAKNIIEALTTSDHQTHHDKSPSVKKKVFEFDTQNSILAQNKIISQQIEELKKQIIKMH